MLLSDSINFRWITPDVIVMCLSSARIQLLSKLCLRWKVFLYIDPYIIPQVVWCKLQQLTKYSCWYLLPLVAFQTCPLCDVVKKWCFVCKECFAVTVFQNRANFSAFESTLNYYDMLSMAETRIVKLATAQRAAMLLSLNRTCITRVYPKGQRIDSSNFDPLPMWICGCHLVAMNYQTPGSQKDFCTPFNSCVNGLLFHAELGFRVRSFHWSRFFFWVDLKWVSNVCLYGRKKFHWFLWNLVCR